ncbi:transcriptional regulator [Salinarchaeum sp. Harcht-Bsk1]|uniref:Tfx family DNA-binding protein n=1 Tax=Salinarchaeum sp. Harcht-Bsk1 TaxID=1333523 RepID=UPI0003423E3D|nr:Tfx family DNA-binding protein [Salinarchaeum sp. Harcht-Bsk1]AGN00268.1 transcriptional regulator [Salinarchaeum sp. Harcht-Bsk1]
MTDSDRGDGSTVASVGAVADSEAADILADAGFDAEASVLTPRQAEVLALRERGLAQNEIAERLGTSRANVSSVESSARRNVEKARATVAVAEALQAPVRLQFEPGTDVYEIPDRVYAACDDAGVKVDAATPELISIVTEAAGGAFEGRRLVDPVTIAVTAEGEIRVRTA